MRQPLTLTVTLTLALTLALPLPLPLPLPLSLPLTRRHFYRVECASMEGGPFVCVGADALGEGDAGYGACHARGGSQLASSWAAAGELPTPPAAAGLAQCMPIDLERAGTLTVARTLTLTLTLP